MERRQVRFPDDATADRYLAADDDLPEAATLNRPVSAGELLPRSAIAEEAGADLVEVPISVASDDLPATVRQGSVVDIWVAPKVAAVGGQQAQGRAGADRRGRGRRAARLGQPGSRSRPGRSSSGCPPTGPTTSVRRSAAISDGRVVVARKG